MACRSTNLSKEEIINNRKNPSIILQPKINQVAEETRDILDQLRNMAVKIDEKYFLYGDIPVKERVSESTKRKAHLSAKSITKDDDIKRMGGTFIHDVMSQLMDFHFNKKGSITEIKRKALSGEVKLKEEHFNSLNNLARKLIAEINAIQTEIDPKGKATLHSEQFVMDFMKDVGGTMDVLVVFSDNTGLNYDFKTSNRNAAIGRGQMGVEVVNNPFPYYDLTSQDLSMGEYSRIAREVIGIKKMRQNRLIPIAVNYNKKKFGEGEKGEYLIPSVNVLLTETDQENEFLKPIPVGGEQSDWAGITTLVEKQFRLMDSISETLKKGGLTIDEKNKLQARIDNINKSIKRTLVDKDIKDIILTIRNLVKDAKTRLSEAETIKGEPNPSYLSLSDLDNYISETNVYRDIIGETQSYFADIKESNPDLFVKLRNDLYNVYPLLNQVYEDLKQERMTRIESQLPQEYLDENGHLLPMEALNFSQLTFLKISEINNPIFKEIWKVVEEAQYDIKKKFEDMDEKIYSKTDAIFKWASDNKMSREDAWKIMIDYSDGNLFPKLTKGFYKKMRAHIEEGGEKGIRFVHDNYEIRDQKKWAKEYEVRLEGFKASEKIRYNNLEATIDSEGKTIASVRQQKEEYNRSIDNWVKTNDLIGSDEAWLNKYNRRRYLKLKDSVVRDNYSDEYKKIMSIKPIHEFYEMWHDYMEEFSSILGIHDYSVLPPNFIPNIRKEFMEHLTSDGFHGVAAMKEFKDSFNVREEDVYLGTASDDGLVRKVPILFTNKFFTDGKVDNTRKSYDLSRSLTLFGHMAYNYEHMSKIEPKINALKAMMGDPTSEQGGIEAHHRLGQRIKGKIKPYLTVEGRTTETYKLLEDITDFYLYGIKFKNETLIKGWDTTHLLTKGKNFNSTIKLSFAVIPASGAWLAGKIGTIVTGGKGIQYTNEQLGHATVMMATEAYKYLAITNFFDAPNDNYLERDLLKHTSSWINKYATSRTGFAPLRGADKNIVNHILVAMAQNWGVNPDGSIIRFTEAGKKAGAYKDIKSILELLEIGENKKGSIKGLSKQGFIQFRAAVKKTAGEVIGNMNPDDVGAVDLHLLNNQMMAFKTWLPAIVQEYVGDLKWDDTTQALRWGRFASNLKDYSRDVNFTKTELEQGKYWYAWVSKVILPNMAKTILDLTTFGLAPRMGMKRVNEERAKNMFYQWQVANPGLREKVTYEHFLEVKEAQTKAMLMQLRFIFGVLGLAMFLGGKGDDDEARWKKNAITRTAYKIFAKGGSELTFMYNPNEAIRIIGNPLPIVSLLTLAKSTVFNGFDESRDLIFGEDSKLDKSPAGYYMSQWIYGGPQITRLFEVFENFKASPYDVYSSRTR